MTTATLPQIDSQRALTLAAFISLIDSEIYHDSERQRICNAHNLLRRLISAGLAACPTRTTTTMMGLRATADCGTSKGLLRAWQHAARDALAHGVRP